jgi:neutral ceramidase
VGTPLGGYTARSFLFTGISRPDDRTTPYAVGFVPSAGIQTRPTVKVLWLENGDVDVVLVKVDLIYSSDHIVEKVTEQLQAATGRNLAERVIIAANHSHQSWGPFSTATPYWLGGDRYDDEIGQRLTAAITETALRAYDSREPVSLGSGWVRDWDPTDQVYRDRRGDNNDLRLWGESGQDAGKDPNLHVLRVDRTDGTPLAMSFTFGIHGIGVGEDSPMVSSEAPGHVELAVQEAFDSPVVVMHFQGSGGDASPSTTGERFEALERLSERAVPAIYDLWSRVPTSADPVALEAVSRHMPQSLSSIRVRRGDLRYLAEPARADDVVYAPDGSVQSPIDEFYAPNGAVFCGDEEPRLPGAGVGASVYPYKSCIATERMLGVLELLFDLGSGTLTLPLPAMEKAGTTAFLVGDVPTLAADGTTSNEPLFVGVFPGEATALFGEQFRVGARDQLGHNHAWMISYAQDHEGYLLLPEDWLRGGYEPNINQWGPLQGEYLLESVLDLAEARLGNGLHDAGRSGPAFEPTEYPDMPAPPRTPDPTPTAGTRVNVEPAGGLWTPDEMPVDLAVPAEVRRVTGIVQLAWEGGDPMVDSPRVTLERQVGAEWMPVETRAGRPVDDALPDILLTWTPDPPRPHQDPQTHRWWAAWQAVAHHHDRAALPEGLYRLIARGQRFSGSEQAWPWTTTPYEVASDPFTLVPANLTIEPTEGGFWVSLVGPESGWRLVDVEGEAQGHNPVRGRLQVVIDGAVREVDGAPVVEGRTFVAHTDPWTRIVVTDVAGNVGTAGAP